jgi:hypothetical protein
MPTKRSYIDLRRRQSWRWAKAKGNILQPVWRSRDFSSTSAAAEAFFSSGGPNGFQLYLVLITENSSIQCLSPKYRDIDLQYYIFAVSHDGVRMDLCRMQARKTRLPWLSLSLCHKPSAYYTYTNLSATNLIEMTGRISATSLSRFTLTKILSVAVQDKPCFKWGSCAIRLS